MSPGINLKQVFATLSERLAFLASLTDAQRERLRDDCRGRGLHIPVEGVCSHCGAPVDG